MKKEWFKTQYRIVPVHAENENRQVAVLVEVKYSFIHEFQPMAKKCLNENGELVDKPAIFDTQDDAVGFIAHLTSSIE